MRNKKNKSDANDFDNNKSGLGYPKSWGLLLNWSPSRWQRFGGSTEFVGRREPEVSGDEEGDPIWKHSNTNGTVGPRRRETAENNKSSITCLIFELETPYFAWRFVWTVQTKNKF